MRAMLTFTIDPVTEADHLTRGVRNKILRIAMNKASAKVKASVINLAPARLGYLKKSFRIKIKNYKSGNVWVAIIGPKSDYKPKKGKRKRGETKGQPIIHQPSRYAHLVEKGTRYAGARPYLLPALRATQSQYRQTLLTSVREQIAALLPKA